MAWQRLDDRNHPLEKIGELTIRLLRIAAHQQLARGEAQLQAFGVPAKLAKPYEKYAKEDAIEKEAPPLSNLKVIEKGSF